MSALRLAEVRNRRPGHAPNSTFRLAVYVAGGVRSAQPCAARLSAITPELLAQSRHLQAKSLYTLELHTYTKGQIIEGCVLMMWHDDAERQSVERTRLA